MERTISVRLDDESERALRTLMRGGTSRSQAIRRALVEAADARRRRRLEAEARRVGSDPEDRREMQEVLAFMESLDDAG